MKNFKFSLILKISGIVFIAFAVVLGNEIRLGIDRYIKNTLEADANVTTRNLDKFAKSYIETITLQKVDLSSPLFQKLYSMSVGDSSKIKCLVNANGKILNLSREGVDYPNISFILDEYLDTSSWPAYLNLSSLSEQERLKLEEALQEESDQAKILTIEGHLGEPNDYYANEFDDFQFKTIKLDDQVIASRDYNGKVTTYSGPVSTYMSYNMEIIFSSTLTGNVKSSSGISQQHSDTNSMVVLNYKNAMDGLQYQIQKNFMRFKATAKELSQNEYDYAQYYILNPYEYNDKYYSTVMMRLDDWSLLGDTDDNNAMTEEELLDKVTVGYIFVTQEYDHLTMNAFQQFMLDNSSTYFLSFILIIMICISIAYIIIKPIRKIDTTAKHISRKEFDYPIDTSRHDELGDLARSIDMMSKELEKTINNLHQKVDRVRKLEVMRKEFVSNFTHEIKTPLGIINGFSELVELEQDEEKRNEYIEIIQSETNRINELVLAMLDLSKMESQNISLTLEDIDLLDIVDECLDSMSYMFEKKHIQLDTQLDSSELKVDRFKMEMVVDNFISNALRYTDEGKTVHILLDDHQFVVENEGAHIPEDELEKVWLTFHKVDKARNEKGTGLGLAICKAVLDLHQFHYYVKNTDRGVLFAFEWKQ